MASSKVLEAVKEGKQALAKFRAANPNVLLDVTEADLKGADLRGDEFAASVIARRVLANGFDTRSTHSTTLMQTNGLQP